MSVAAFLLALGWVGDKLSCRRKSKEEQVALIRLAATEQLIGAVQTIQDAHSSIVLVEPATV